ncbi:hypothetical protein T492DRAFT_993778 [Pavlovales sp. CCMP2436]|nr:hypothetical protein T492DRAFT_993778 [Pavlovales sp. CCMP2436]|mmetsp:Transcript_37365/g.92968  ORF Transcript_37365/g.92968 Transcript_37365/m.92968 type:complete len:295 (+) Transcript_37365:50-934(+)
MQGGTSCPRLSCRAARAALLVLFVVTACAALQHLCFYGRNNVDRQLEGGSGAVGSESPCTISRRPSWDAPFIVRTASERFRELTLPQRLRETHGSVEVTLSSANTFSYERRKASVGDYFTSLLADAGLPERWAMVDGEKVRSDSLYYWFGEHTEEWTPLLALYDYAPLLATLPPLLPSDSSGLFGQRKPALSFGVGGLASGVPFHMHGPGFSETLHGAKRWLFFPSEPPYFLPNATAAYWLHTYLPQLTNDERTGMVECVIREGEAVFFPDRWYHATINLPGPGEVAVFVSTFL